MRFSVVVLVIAILSCLFPLIPSFIDVMAAKQAVRSVENFQAGMLFFFSLFTLFYTKPWQMSTKGQKHFWFWAVCWWILLFGRSVSWGRDYFPEVPKVYFRSISVVLIGAVVFFLFSPHLRQEIARQWKILSFPVWAFLLAVAGLVISDSIEHVRAIHVLFVEDLRYQSFMEELYEFPLILGLFLMQWPLLQRDVKAHKTQVEAIG